MDFVAKAAEVKKALVAAASVLTALLAADGIPADAKAWIAKALGVLATYGITWKATNREQSI